MRKRFSFIDKKIAEENSDQNTNIKLQRLTQTQEKLNSYIQYKIDKEETEQPYPELNSEIYIKILNQDLIKDNPIAANLREEYFYTDLGLTNQNIHDPFSCLNIVCLKIRMNSEATILILPDQNEDDVNLDNYLIVRIEVINSSPKKIEMRNQKKMIRKIYHRGIKYFNEESFYIAQYQFNQIYQNQKLNSDFRDGLDNINELMMKQLIVLLQTGWYDYIHSEFNNDSTDEMYLQQQYHCKGMAQQYQNDQQNAVIQLTSAINHADNENLKEQTQKKMKEIISIIDDKNLEEHNTEIPSNIEMAIQYLNKAIDLFNIKDNENALQQFDQSIEFDQEQQLTWFQKGMILQMKGEFTKAEEALMLSKKMEPEHSLTLSYLSLIKLEKQDYEEAFRQVTDANEFNPGCGFNLMVKGIQHLQLQEWENAITSFKRAKLTLPNCIVTQYALARAQEITQDWAREIICYNEILYLQPDDIIAIYLKGVALEKLDSQKDAIQCQLLAEKLDPIFPLVLVNKGVLYAQFQEKIFTIEYFDKMIKYGRELAVAQYNKSIAHTDIGELEKGQQYYQLAVDLNPYFKTYKFALNYKSQIHNVHDMEYENSQLDFDLQNDPKDIRGTYRYLERGKKWVYLFNWTKEMETTDTRAKLFKSSLRTRTIKLTASKAEKNDNKSTDKDCLNEASQTVNTLTESDAESSFDVDKLESKDGKKRINRRKSSMWSASFDLEKENKIQITQNVKLVNDRVKFLTINAQTRDM